MVQRIALRTAELGEGFVVGRALPTREQRSIGAWCFLDHMGPADISRNGGMHVGAHPHTCLQTFTWLMEGAVLHRDSLGSEQVIRPGQVNLMTAGRGIVHTEDSLPGEVLHGAQLWIALPPEHAEVEPAFDHYPDLPRWSRNGVELTLLAGSMEGREAPARIYSPLMGADLHASLGGSIELELRDDFEYGLLTASGSVCVDGVYTDSQTFAYFEPGRDALTLTLSTGGRCLLIGGRPLERKVSMWWNFVASQREYIDQAYLDWQTGSDRFPPVPGSDGRRLDSPRPPWLPPDLAG